MIEGSDVRIDIFQPDAPLAISRVILGLFDLFEWIPDFSGEHDNCAGRPVHILCIGTDRSTGDALGPLVGTELSRSPAIKARVVGNLERPLHAANLQSELDCQIRYHPKPVVIAVDACLGKHDHVGSIAIGRGPLRPGAGVNKSLPPVGDIFIAGTVNVGGFMEYLVLQNTRLNLVMTMAGVIARGLRMAIAVHSSSGRPALVADLFVADS